MGQIWLPTPHPWYKKMVQIWPMASRVSSMAKWPVLYQGRATSAPFVKRRGPKGRMHWRKMKNMVHRGTFRVKEVP